ncbi:MAG: hypothetical protein DMD83_18735 [Candidatus Rokuibacteriota bacterium]|nr:MAG: hypothetical protein DMD83_18735 [Candidatus Rokubacteria bacterium]
MLPVMERKSPTIRRARHRFARPANVFSELESLRTFPGDEASEGASRLRASHALVVVAWRASVGITSVASSSF